MSIESSVSSAPDGNYLLLVEDNLDDILLLSRALKKLGVTTPVKVLRDGEAALTYLQELHTASTENCIGCPELVLLDLKMPKVNGHEVLKVIKASPLFSNMPVIILTSSDEENDIKACLESGADDYLLKPVSFRDFVCMVQVLVNRWMGGTNCG